MSARVGILLTSPRRSLEKDYVEPFSAALGEPCVVHAPTDPEDHLTDARKMREHATRLITRNSDLKVVWVISTASAIAALEATRELKSDINIVGGAVSSVLLSRVQRPVNFTGVVNVGWELGCERLWRLHALKPDVRNVGVLVNPENQNSIQEFTMIELTAQKLEIAAKRIDARNEDELKTELHAFSKENTPRAVMTTHIPLFQHLRNQIISFQSEKLAVVGHRAFFAEAGAFMAYGSDLREQMRQSAELVKRILNSGRRSRDIEIERPRKFELVIDEGARAKFGATIPSQWKEPDDYRLHRR